MAHFVFYDTPPDMAAAGARVRSDLAVLQMKLALVRLGFALKYSPDQPRYRREILMAGDGRAPMACASHSRRGTLRLKLVLQNLLELLQTILSLWCRLGLSRLMPENLCLIRLN